MPDYRFVCAEATEQPSSGYASRIPHTAWAEFEELIRRLHACKATRDDILRTLVDEHDFQPSVGQLRDQMARWGLRSSRKQKVRATAEQDTVSSSTFSGSDGLQSQRQVSISQVYTNVPDIAFSCMWPQYDLGVLHYETAIEIEVMADTLFLGGRYVAAFNLYCSIYHAAPLSYRHNGSDLAAARFRALVGCLRSSGNAEQRSQIVSIAEAEERKSLMNKYCNPDDINHVDESTRNSSQLMTQFNDRESFRQAMSAAGSGSTVSEVVTRLQLDESQFNVLNWCFDRLKTPEFLALYNEHLRAAGSGVACWTFGGSRTIIYWYLVIDAVSCQAALPCFTIRHTSGLTYTFSLHETFALVATMISSEPWLFSLDRLPLEGLGRWMETLLSDHSLFDRIFKAAVKTTLVPTFAIRVNKSDSDTLALANNYPAYRMPNVGLLKSLAAQTRQSIVSERLLQEGSDEMVIDNISSFGRDDLTFDNLVRQNSNIIEIYVNENCAYDTVYQLRERPRAPLPSPEVSEAVKPFIPHLRSFAERPHLVGSGDPTLTSPMRGSARSSFRSFQSTHLRTKKRGLRWPAWGSRSIDNSGSSTFSKTCSMSMGIT